MSNLPRLYLAAPLFNVAERSFNEQIANMLSSLFSVYLPQRDGGLLVRLVRDGDEELQSAARKIFAADVAAIKDAQAILAILDGRVIDEGVAWELGYATALGKYCIGLQTDERRLLPEGNNPMISCSLRELVYGLDALRGLSERIASDIAREGAVANAR